MSTNKFQTLIQKALTDPAREPFAASAQETDKVAKVTDMLSILITRTGLRLANQSALVQIMGGAMDNLHANLVIHQRKLQEEADGEAEASYENHVRDVAESAGSAPTTRDQRRAAMKNAASVRKTNPKGN